MPYRELAPSILDEAIQSAYKTRPDFQSQTNQVRSAELERKAASAERYPSVGAETDYGLSGVTRARRTAPLMRQPRSAFLFFRVGEYTGIFSGSTLR